MKSYWEGHHEEPFSYYWQNPKELNQFDWTTHKYYFTSISCPYFKNKMPQVPLYNNFITEAKKYADVKIVIIGRDPTILKYQQTRVRGSCTLHVFKDNIKILLQHNPIFVSQELYQLYGNLYLEVLSKQLDFPIQEQEIFEDANFKYIIDIDGQPLDKEVKKACQNS